MGGSKKQAESTRQNQGADFHARIGSKGGSARTEKTKLRGFASMTPERLAEVHAKARETIERKQS